MEAAGAVLTLTKTATRGVQWFFGPAKKGDHAALAGTLAVLLALRSQAAQRLARQQNALGRLLRLIHLFLPRFPWFVVVGVGFLWRAWRERQLLSSELAALQTTRLQLQNNVAELRGETARLHATYTELAGSVDELRASNAQLMEIEHGLKRENESLNVNVETLKASIGDMTIQNEDLLRTTGQLRSVLKIAGESSENIAAVERKLFSAVDDLGMLNQQMQANILEQRRRQLRDIFMKFDVDFESKISDQRQIQRMSAYVKAVYHAKMEKLEDCLRPANDDAGGEQGKVELRWEDFEAALLRDNFWGEHPMPHEHHLHTLPNTPPKQLENGQRQQQRAGADSKSQDATQSPLRPHPPPPRDSPGVEKAG